MEEQNQKVTIEVVTKAPEAPVEAAVRKDTGGDYRYNMAYHRFADSLGVDKYKKDDSHLAGKVALLYDWGKERSGSEETGTIAQTIQNLRRTLGVTLQGESLVNYLFRWIRVDMEGEKLRFKEEEKGLAEEEIKRKVEIQKVAPQISDEELKSRVKESMKPVRKKIKRQVKSQVSKSIQEGIQSAIKGALKE